ncbi:kinase-like protein, partial [Ophiobolus disseminans]
VSHGTDDWNPAFVALNVPSHQVSKSASSVVRDAGYSFESSESALERPPEQEQALKGLGTQFDPQTSGLDHSIWGDAAYQKTHFLETWLRSKIVPSAERRDLPFLPIDQLELIMTYKNISRELQQAGLHEDIKATTTLLCQRRKKSRQRIFAILCMLQLPAQIVDFIRAGIFDEDLPFTFKNSLVYRERTSETKKVETPLSLFEAPCWKPHVRESFERYQAQVSAPIFKLSWTKGEKVLHFLLKDQLVLPFMPVKDTSGDGELEIFLRHYGGTSTVRKVKIHPAHFNPCPKMPANTDVYLAVKELTAVKTSNKPDEEARALKRVNAKQDPHLIRLLATYTYEGRFHLIFPWADGNLKDLWMMPNVQFIEQNRNLGPVKWMATQILGLACALQKIHYCPIDDDNVEDLPAHDKERLYGRHGDLKPENILWFRNEEESHEDDTIGILKIADFGFADFHSKHSRSNVRRSAVGGFTDTYKAPEYDVNQRVSPQYDIWSFGCILLQFVVWYLRGWQGVDDFSKERTADSKGAMMAADIFFGLEASNMNAFRARAKLSVVEMFKSLKNDGACSDYILDLLEYVQTDLLRVDRSKRAKIYDIVKKFKQLHDYCQNSSEYCLSRTKLASRTDSELSEIVEVPISPGKA